MNNRNNNNRKLKQKLIIKIDNSSYQRKIMRIKNQRNVNHSFKQNKSKIKVVSLALSFFIFGMPHKTAQTIIFFLYMLYKQINKAVNIASFIFEFKFYYVHKKAFEMVFQLLLK